MPYTVDQLIADFRSDVYDRADVDDAGNPRDTLWSPEDVLRYANHALTQWAEDTLYVRRNMELTVTPGKFKYYTGQDILEIVRVAYAPDPASRFRSLCVFNLEDGHFEDDYGLIYLTAYDLENRRGTPRGVTLDYDPSYLRVYPIPTENGVLSLNLVVYPPEVQCGMPLPTQNRRDIHLLLLWMKHLAYAKQDADVTDLGRSAEYGAQYREQVIDRAAEIDRERRNGRIMRPRW